MQDILSLLQSLRRPRLLIRAARFAAGDYRRETRLARILGMDRPQRSGAVILTLLEIEATLNDERRAARGGYSVARHVEVLSAIMGEAQRLQSRGGEHTASCATPPAPSELTAVT
ncbi:MAG: hypothetical protein CML50_17220 [Rhodobacteraceae bacterium]|jgi:hypothetical protein|uniref:Uncharacterized protein n=1 Tax=Salipiger profundus TaxID=1229727 RepID=A0A1U7D9H7_9RHOB|nr:MULTISPECIES: DUF6477 family protein [Salipiger]APX24824.1 hypothetical protein Ga0080559_TMP4028 [Salipiger profundus]MAB07741.1 hypothetical protein [Paracoccaceae bacterium]GFZ98074.1 hypothetical protein GCM10011326_06830 [Salipiger profundus]SFC98117.1 hypothetical protein SAMN05444415_106169 [Salipiger profundus]